MLLWTLPDIGGLYNGGRKNAGKLQALMTPWLAALHMNLLSHQEDIVKHG
jgi:hypothetical protein